MMKPRRIARVLLLLFLAIPTLALAQQSSAANGLMGNETEVILQKRLTDPIKERSRTLRVLVSYNATNYFIVEGKQAGLEFELTNEFSKYLNKQHTAETQVHFIYITLPFDQLIPALLNGQGDMIAAGMTVTPNRQEMVDFSRPYLVNISEIVVKNRTAENISTAEDLSGKTVHVVAGSSYFTHLLQLNKKLSKNNKPPINIVEVDKNFVSEDILQLVNEGKYQYAVVDSNIAEIWSQVLDNITPITSATINTGGQIAWAVRKGNSALKFKINSFLKNHRQGTTVGNVLFNRYYKNTHWIDKPVNDQSMKRFYNYQNSFIKYGKQYNIDWIMLTALGYQESKLNQWVESKYGAVGVMQIKPSTAEDKQINISGVRKSYDKNIHAATKYLAFLRKRYFSDPKIPPLEQLAFTLAAYNAGPAKITEMRNKAKLLGKDPYKWFFSVEGVTRKYASSEPVEYVANIMKYYLDFKSVINAEKTRRKAAAEVK